MTNILINRELLERLADPSRRVPQAIHIHNSDINELRAILAAPIRPDGDAISLERVRAEADAFFDWPTADKSSVTTTSCLIFARCIAGMIAAERDAEVAELRNERDNMRTSWGLMASERDTLRQQLADAAAGNTKLHVLWTDAVRQRDKLAGLLSRARGCIDAMGWDELEAEIDAALEEADKP